MILKGRYLRVGVKLAHFVSVALFWGTLGRVGAKWQSWAKSGTSKKQEIETSNTAAKATKGHNAHNHRGDVGTHTHPGEGGVAEPWTIFQPRSVYATRRMYGPRPMCETRPIHRSRHMYETNSIHIYIYTVTRYKKQFQSIVF